MRSGFFEISPGSGAYVFSSDSKYYYPETQLPQGVHPSENREEAFTYLIRKYLQAFHNQEVYYNALCYLKPEIQRYGGNYLFHAYLRRGHFEFIIAKKAFAFIFKIDSQNSGSYSGYTLLPAGTDPYREPEAAIIFLSRQYIKYHDPIIHHAICSLKKTAKKLENVPQTKPVESSMEYWTPEYFSNYLGDNKEYSDDSDNEEQKELYTADEKLYLKEDSKLVLLIENRLGNKTEKNLLARTNEIMDKILNRNLTSSTIEGLTKDAKGRQAYFPLPREIKKSEEIKIDKLFFHDELALINIAMECKTLDIKAITTIDGQKVIKITGVYQEVAINYVLKRRYHIPLFRGIAYLVDRWRAQAKSVHLRTAMGEDLMNYAEANVVPPGFNIYHLTDYKQIDKEALRLRADKLKQQLIDFRLSQSVIHTGKESKSKGARAKSAKKREFENFLDYLQYLFSNGIKSYLSHLNIINEKYPGTFPNSRNHFLPFSQMPFHALRYAFGEKNPYKEYSPPVLWDNNGRPQRPHTGKFVISIHPLEDFLDSDRPNVLPYLANTVGVTPGQTIGPEWEISFLSQIPKERLFKQWVMRYPSFHRETYPEKYHAKYGINAELYKKFRRGILDPLFRDDTTELLTHWLCLFYSIKALEAVYQSVNPDDVILFNHASGDVLRTEYPSENYKVDSPIIKENEKKAALHLGSAERVLTDEQSWIKDRRGLFITASPPAPRKSPARTPEGKPLNLRSGVFSLSPKSAELGLPDLLTGLSLESPDTRRQLTFTEVVSHPPASEEASTKLDKGSESSIAAVLLSSSVALPSSPDLLLEKDIPMSNEIFAKWLECAMMLRDAENNDVLQVLISSLQEQKAQSSSNLYEKMRKMQRYQGDEVVLQQALNDSLKEPDGESSPRTLQLEKEAKKSGLVRHEVARHGNCLYDAFFDQLREREIKLGPYRDKIHSYRDLRTEVCQHIISDLTQADQSEYRHFLAESPDNYILKLMTDGTWGGELELRALSRVFKVIIIVINSDGKNSRGQVGPDIYKPFGSSESTPIITLGYERPVHYQSLRNGVAPGDEKLFQSLFLKARVAEVDTQPLHGNVIKSKSSRELDSVASSSSSTSSSVSSSSSETERELTKAEIKMDNFKEKLVSLCKDKGYTFTLKRSSTDMLIQVATVSEVSKDVEEMKKDLVMIVELLQKMVMDEKIETKQFKIEFNWEVWSLKIKAEPATLDRILSLLKESVVNYFPSVVQNQAALFHKSKLTVAYPENLLLPSSAAGRSYEEPAVTCTMQ